MRNSEQHSEKGAAFLVSAPAERGTRTAAGVFVPDGRQLFSAPAGRGTRTAAGVFAPNGRRAFSLRFSGECAAAAAGACRAPRRGKRVDTKVSTLLTPTSFYFLAWRRSETGDRFENRGTAVGLPQHVFLRLFAVHRQRTATHTVKSTQARHDRAAQPFGTLYRMAPTD